jgi:GGDEF domain-containing protein
MVKLAAGISAPDRGDPARPARHDDIAACTDLVALVERRLAECRRVRQGMALLCIDVAGHDEWVRRHGEDVAHHLLRDLAQRLRGGLRQHDELRRLSATRFAALLCGTSGPDAQGVRARLERVLGAPYRVGPWLLGPQVRVGCAASPPVAARAEALVDLAMQALDVARPGA